MINSLKQHEKTFRKFVEWIEKNRWTLKITYFIEQGNIKGISDREFLSLLVEFCDEQGYYVTVFVDTNFMGTLCFAFSVISPESYPLSVFYNSRTQATQEAIKKCFELMEKNNE